MQTSKIDRSQTKFRHSEGRQSANITNTEPI